MLGGTGHGGGVAVAAVHGRVNGALARRPVNHAVPNVLVALQDRGSHW